MRPEDYDGRILTMAYLDVLDTARTLGHGVQMGHDRAVITYEPKVFSDRFCTIFPRSNVCRLDVKWERSDPERWARAEPVLARLVAAVDSGTSAPRAETSKPAPRARNLQKMALSEEDQREVARAFHAREMTAPQLANKFQVSKGTIYRYAKYFPRESDPS